MKKVLMISYFFPPCGGSGVQRSSKFVKYLPKFNWKPYVLTVRERNLPKDLSLLRDIPPEAEIFETFSLEKIFIESSEKAVSEIDFIDRIGGGERKRSGSYFLSPLKKFVNRTIFQPDSAILWFPFAVVKGFNILRKYKIDLIYATGSPWTALLIGAALKRLTGKPLVVDLRDPWSMSENKKVFDAYLELYTFQLADAIILNNIYVEKEYANKYPAHKPKMFAITNGYDEEDFINLKPVEDNEKRFRLVLSGIVQSYTPITTFVEAVKNLLMERPDLKKKLEILFIGQTPAYIVYDNKLKDIVNIMPYKPHNEILSYLASADLLLIIMKRTPNTRWQTPGKVYEYFAAKKPILAMVPAGNPLFDLIKSTRTGSVVEYSDIKGIRHYLLEYIEGHIIHEPNVELISQFERKNLTAQLVKVFRNSLL